MTEREQFLFDALCNIRRQAVADRKDDALVIEQIYESATRAVRNVTHLPRSPGDGQGSRIA